MLPVMGLVRTVANWSAHRERRRGGDAGVGDDGLLGHLQRHLAHVPAGQVRGVERFVCGHGVADGLAEPVPGVGA